MKLMVEINDNEYMGIKEYPNNITSYPVTIHLYDAVRNGIPLEQEPKAGHWEWVQYDYNPKLGNWHCSECRCIVVECVGKEDKGGIPLYKYCPQCGIKMKSQESEEV